MCSYRSACRSDLAHCIVCIRSLQCSKRMRWPILLLTEHAWCRTIPNPKPAVSEGGKAGITLAALLVLGLVCFGAVMYVKRRRRRAAIARAPEMHTNLVHEA